MTNKKKSTLYMVLSVLLYSIPLAVWVIINRNELFKDNSTSISFFVLLAVFFCVIFAKKAIKIVAKKTTPLLLGSLIIFVVAVGIETITQTLISFAIASILGSLFAWLPFQLSTVYANFARDKDGKINQEQMTFKEALSEVVVL